MAENRGWRIWDQEELEQNPWPLHFIMVGIAVFLCICFIVVLITLNMRAGSGAQTSIQDLINQACQGHRGVSRLDQGFAICRDGVVRSY